MTGKRIPSAIAIAALLLVGAGCASATPTPPHSPSGAMMPKAGLNATGPISPDDAVNAVLNDANDEKESALTVEKDSAEVTSDSAATNAYGDATYDVNASQ